MDIFCVINNVQMTWNLIHWMAHSISIGIFLNCGLSLSLRNLSIFFMKPHSFMCKPFLSVSNLKLGSASCIHSINNYPVVGTWNSQKFKKISRLDPLPFQNQVFLWYLIVFFTVHKSLIWDFPKSKSRKVGYMIWRSSSKNKGKKCMLPVCIC